MPLAHALAHEPRAQHRQQRQRDDQRADQGEDHGVRHRLEQRAGRPRQHVDRQEADHDHRHRVEQRAIHFRRRVADDLLDVERRPLAQRDLAEDVFHHHHRAIHQDAEIHRADREQVGRGVLDVQTDERKQQRQRNGGGDDQAGAHVVEEKDQDHHHQQHAAQQVLLDDVGGQLDQVDAVVERMNLDVLGQDVVVELLRLRLDPLQHVLGLFAGALQDHALHRVVLFLVAELAQSRSDADDHVRDILHQHRRAVVHRQHHVADVLLGGQTALAAHVVELAALRVETAAGVAVVGRQRGLHLGRRQPDRRHFGRVQQHLVLHGAAAEARIVRHPGHRLVLRRDGPVLDGLQLHRRAVGALQHVAVDQPRRRGQRRHRGRDAARQAQARHAVEHFLAREIVVGAAVERDGDVGQPVQRDRADGGGLGDAVHADLDRHRDQPLHFLGRVAGPLGDDLDDRRRQVGIGIHRQARQRAGARAGQQQRQQQDQEGLGQRRGHDAVHDRRRARHGFVGGQWLAHWFCMNWTKMPPSTTIRSPAVRPRGMT